MERIRVEAYAGHKGAQEPRVLWIGDDRHEVMGIRDRWLDQHADAFRLRTADGWLMLVRHDRQSHTWWLVKRELMDS